MIQELNTIEFAWRRIKRWSSDYSETALKSNNLEDLDSLFPERLEQSLECGSAVMSALEEDLSIYASKMDKFSFSLMAKAAWNQKALQEHQHRIRGQVMATSLLLQVLNLPTPQSRSQLLEARSSRFRESDESVWSIVPSRMSSRFSSRHSLSTYARESRTSIGSVDMVYRRLSFENELFTARVYKRNYRNPQIRSLFQSGAEALESDQEETPEDKPLESDQEETPEDKPLAREIETSQLHPTSTAIGRRISEVSLVSATSFPARPKNLSAFWEGPLHALARRSNTSQEIELIVSQGADLQALDYAGRTPLLVACEFGSRENVTTLLRLGPPSHPTYNPRVADRNGNRQLHSTVLNDFIYNQLFDRDIESLWIDHMISCGVDINAVNRAGKSPLYLAAVTRHPGFVDLFIQKGAKPLTPILLNRLTSVYAKSEDSCRAPSRNLGEMRVVHSQILDLLWIHCLRS